MRQRARRQGLFALAALAVLATVAVRIYEEVIKAQWPEPAPKTLRFWKDETALPVDLSRFFNNDGVADAANPGDANFDCPDHPPDIPGSGYPAEALPESGTVFDAGGGAIFLFPVVAPGEFNNLACVGQRIAAPTVPGRQSRTFSSIAVLGAAENGAASAPLRFEYEDGSTGSAVLSFPDWCEEPGPEVIVAASAPYRYTLADTGDKSIRQEITCRLYAARLPLDSQRNLDAIILPEQPNLHIFAMTLSAAVPAKEIAFGADALAQFYHRAALLAKEPSADLSEPVSELAKALDETRPPLAAVGFERQWVWLRTQYEYLVHRLGAGTIRRGSQTEAWAERTAAGIRADLRALLAGSDPFRLRRGHLVKGYVSDIDGQIQPYALYVPDDYEHGTPRPLVVHLHGHGWYRPFQGIPTYPFRDAIVVSPHGRGSMDYMFVAEEDVLACIDEACKDYSIDPHRVYLLGGSMGGTGCWSLATKYPDRFAAIGPSAANADSKAWSAVAGTRGDDTGAYAWLRATLRDSLDPVTYAGNLLHVPAFFLHGDADRVVPVENSRSMAKALAEAGCPFVYREGKGGGHGWQPRDVVAEQHDYIFKARREQQPRRVRLKAAYLKYGRAYWVRILAFDRTDSIGEVDARVGDSSLVDVRSRHVTAIELDLTRCPVDTSKAVIIAVDGQPAFNDIVPPGGRITLALDSARWRAVPPLTGLRKKPYLEGPVADAYTRSFLVVIGTTAADAGDRLVLREEAGRFADDWQLLYTKPPRTKTDREITSADIEQHNLILYGGPADNAITARIADRLPIHIKGGAVHVNGRMYSGGGTAIKFCYPNPLNPERLVVVIAGAARARDVFQSNNLFGNWFQWGPYDNRAWFDYAIFDSKTRSEETCLEFGFFGSDWGFQRETTWFADPAARAGALARRIPAFAEPPDADTVYLSDLMPATIRQHKLPVGFDTSAEGRALSIGRPPRVFARGLGVRPPSKVAFLVNPPDASEGRRFARFRATVGIDLEGATGPIPPWRDKDEWVKFLVYGNGHLLYQTQALRWKSKPVEIDVPISGVQTLELEAWCSPARWLVGSAAWGDARLVKR